MTLIQIAEPVAEPVSTDELRLQRRIDSGHEDELLDLMIAGARRRVEGFTHRRLVTQDVALRLSGLCPPIRLPVAPVQSVVSVTYLDTAGASQVLAADQYRLDLSAHPARLIPATDAIWPLVLAEPDTVTVTLRVGYGLAAAVPADLRMAVLHLAAWMHRHRDDGDGLPDGGLPRAVEALALPHVLWV